jgi:ribulose-phosphate 3-epimerase
VRAASHIRAELHLDFALQVEGAVGRGNLQELARAGADILVVGSVIFDNDDPQARLTEMIRLAGEIGLTSKV